MTRIMPLRRYSAQLSSLVSSRASQFRVMRVFLCSLLVSILPLTERAAAVSHTPVVPAARIVYTADTLGFLHPCGSCGGSSQGGLARRAALLPGIASAVPNSLVVAGPDEFYADREYPSPEHATAVGPLLHKAFFRMPYTAVYLSPAAVRDMKALSLALPPNGVAVSTEPVTRVFRAGNFTAACVFLPSGLTDNGAPRPDQILAAQAAAKEAAKTADLVIGISPWGMRAENALAASFAGYFDIILGGGRGIAVPGQGMGDPAAPGPLWVRSDRQGRAVNVLDIYAVPEPGTPWLEGVHFMSHLEFLAPSLPEDPEVRELTRNVKDTD